MPARHAMRADDGTWMQMAPDAAALVTKTAAGRKPYPASEMVGWAAAPDPKPAPAEHRQPAARRQARQLLPSGGWPEGVIDRADRHGGRVCRERGVVRAAAARRALS